MEINNFVFQDIRGKQGRKPSEDKIVSVERQSRGQCGELGGWKVKDRGSSHRFGSQTELSAKSCPGLMRPYFKCAEQMVRGPGRESQKTRAMSAVSITSSETGSGTVFMAFRGPGILISCVYTR